MDAVYSFVIFLVYIYDMESSTDISDQNAAEVVCIVVNNICFADVESVCCYWSLCCWFNRACTVSSGMFVAIFIEEIRCVIAAIVYYLCIVDDRMLRY
jgi:hypothetical protein